MLGFSKEPGVKLSKEAAQEMIASLIRHQKGEYTEEEIEWMHEDKVTPEVLIIGEHDTLDPKCEYCDEYRDGGCPGRNIANMHDECKNFCNKYDEETCKYCKFAEIISNDNRHVNCPTIKKEKRHINRWCNKFAKKD